MKITERSATAGAWSGQVLRRESPAMDYVEQLLRGSSAAAPQRSASSGRHPRVAGSGGVVGLDFGASTASPGARRSASVGRRQQEMQELATVLQEIQHKGRTINGLMQDLPSSIGGAPPKLDARNTANQMQLAGGRSNATASASGGPGATAGPSSKPTVAGSIRGMETLASKLEILGRFTPRKSPRGMQDSFVPSRGDGGPGASHYRDMLAAANAGLLQGQDTAKGSRDQTPASAVTTAAAAGTAGVLGLHAPSSSNAITQPPSVIAARGGAGHSLLGNTSASNQAGSRGNGSAAAGNYGAELAASMILQNRRRTSEDLLAADRRLLDIQSQLGCAGLGRAGAAGTASGDQYSSGQRPSRQPQGSGALGAEANAGAASAMGDDWRSGHAGGRRMENGASAGSAGAPTEGGMLRSFLATLSEAMPPPQTPMASRPAVDATPARPVQPTVTREGTSSSYGLRVSRDGNGDLTNQAQAQLRLPQPTAAGQYDNKLGSRPTSSHSGQPKGAALTVEIDRNLATLQRLGQNLSVDVLGQQTHEHASESVARARFEEWGSGKLHGPVRGPLTQAASNHESQPAGALYLGPGTGTIGGGLREERSRSSAGAGSDAWVLPPRAPRQAWPMAGQIEDSGGHARSSDSSEAGSGRVAGRSETARPSSSGIAPQAHAATGGPVAQLEAEGLNMALLLQQRKKEKARRDELDKTEATAAATRAQQAASDWKGQYDTLLTRYLAQRERLEVMEAERNRVALEGCSNCDRARERIQQASDAAANTAAQLRELQTQLKEARGREETLRRQLDHATSSASDQASANTRLRTLLEGTLSELLRLANTGDVRSTSSGGGSSSTASSTGSDVDGMLMELRRRLEAQKEAAERQAQLLRSTQEQLEEERAAAAAAKSAAAAERAGAASSTAAELAFLRGRAESLQEDLERQRALATSQELRMRQLEEERDRAVRYRDATALELEAEKAQLAAAAKQQDTLVGRLYDGQRAREDAEVLLAQIRSLTGQLEQARQAAARSEALERRLANEREAREERDARLAALESQLSEREAALGDAKRRLREAEASLNSAVVTRHAAVDDLTTTRETARSLTEENVRMIQHLEKLQQDKKRLEGEVSRLAAQVAVGAEEHAKLRQELSAARGQLGAMRDNPPIRDATLAQHQLSGELAEARQEAAALRVARDGVAEYAGLLARQLRRHGLGVPEPPSVADITSQIGALQSQLTAESAGLAAARQDAAEMRQRAEEARREVEDLKREVQTLTLRCQQLEVARAAAVEEQQAASLRDARRIQELDMALHTAHAEATGLKGAALKDRGGLELQVTRLSVQVETLGGARAQAEAAAKTALQDLAALQKVLVEKEKELEASRMGAEAAKAAAVEAEERQRAAEQEAAAAAREKSELTAQLEAASAEVERLQSELTALQGRFDYRDAEYTGLYEYTQQALGEKADVEADRDAAAGAAAAAEAEAERLRGEVEALRAALEEAEQKLVVKPKMAELQYRVNELAARVAELTAERDAARYEAAQKASEFQDEQEAHFATDGRAVRLGEEVDRLRGILRMYSIPF